jgi:hypothetical protein
VLNPYPNAELDIEWDQSLTQPTDNYSNDNIGFPYYAQQPIDEEATKKENLLTMLQDFVKNAIHAPLQKYHSTYTQTITVRRIQLATTPSILRTTAQRIAAAIQKEPPVTQPTLTGLITDCTTKQTADLRLQVKSLQDQLNAQRKPKDDTPRKGKPKDDTPRKNIPQGDTAPKPPKTRKAAATSSGTGNSRPETQRTMHLPIPNGSTNKPRSPTSEPISNPNIPPTP